MQFFYDLPVILGDDDEILPDGLAVKELVVSEVGAMGPPLCLADEPQVLLGAEAQKILQIDNGMHGGT